MRPFSTAQVRRQQQCLIPRSFGERIRYFPRAQSPHIDKLVDFQSVLWIDAIYIQMAAKKRIIRSCFILKSRVAEPEPKNYEVPAPAPGEL